MKTSDTGNQPTGLADAAQAMEGLLSGDAGTESHQEDQHDESEQHSTEGDERHTEEGEGNAEGEGQETNSEEGSEEQAEAEGDAEGEEGNEEGHAEQPQLLTVTIDGKQEQVTLDEAAKGYQRQADYSRKTAELADNRRAHEANVQAFESEKQSVTQERGQYTHLLRALEQRLQELTPTEPDWVQLAQSVDPAEYQRTRATWDAVKEQQKAAKEERERVEGVQRAEGQKVQQAKLVQGRAKLLDYQPDWKDPKKWDADRSAIFKYGNEKLGFTPQEIANASDPRAIIAVHKAMLYDDIMANKPKPGAQPARSGKPAPKTLPAGSATQGQRKPSTDVTKAKQRLAQTGRLGDAASVFEKLL